MPWIAVFAVGATFSVFAAPLQDQPERRGPIQWAKDLDTAYSVAEGKRPVLILVQPKGSKDLPMVFRNPEVEDASLDRFVFVQVEYDPRLEVLKPIRPSQLPVILCTDAYRNFLGTSGVRVDPYAIQAFLKGMETKARNLRKRVEALAARAQKVRGRRAKYIRTLIELTEVARGYPEIERANATILRFGREDLLKAEDLKRTEPAGARKRFEWLISTYKGSPIGPLARLRLALLLDAEGKPRQAFAEVEAAAGTSDRWPELVAEVKRVRAALLRAGRTRILDALELGLNGEPKKAQECLARLEAAYQGTPIEDLIGRVREDLQR